MLASESVLQMSERSHSDGTSARLALIANPPRWPNGARCAAAITFDMDSDSMLHVSLPATAHRRVTALSWLRYDRVAVPRILQIYRHYGLRQTFFVPGWCMERYPALIEAMLADGHEVALHGYIHELANEQPGRDREQYWLERSLQAMQRVVGARPDGWRAPLYSFSEHTADLLAGAGFRYDSSLMGDDVPYVLRTGAGDLLELPVDWASDDWPQYVQSLEFEYLMPINSPDRAMDVFRAEFDAAWEYGGLWIATWHPFVSARPARARVVAELLDYIAEKGDVWLAPLREIAEHTRSIIADGSYSPRVDELPYLREPVPELRGNDVTTHD
jgi:peptidoglycan/xylan/chitin deacetylase (PgdA/CDA1 family)